MAKRQPKIKQPETWDEFLEQAWTLFKTLSGDDEIPPASYEFKVGQPVILGAREECRVEEVHEDGRLLVISYHDRGQTYGTPYDNHRRLPLIVWWISVYPIEEMEETRFQRPRIRSQHYQKDVGSFLDESYRRGLLDSPVYQRDYVWTLEDKQRLIGSLFARVDIGKFVLLEHRYPENRLEIVDGKQRLGALREYRENRFPYEGYTYYQLSGRDKQALFDPMVQVVVLDAEYVKPVDVLWTFLSINEGGVPQKPEHVARVRELYDKAKDEEANSDDWQQFVASALPGEARDFGDGEE